MLERMTGTVKWFSPDRGYGFIVPTNDPSAYIFLHISEVKKARRSGQVVEGELISFIPGPGRGHQQRATCVQFD